MSAEPATALLLRRDELLPKTVVQENFAQEFGVGCDGWGQIGIQRQANGEDGTLAVFAAGLNFAAVMMNDEIACHQMNPILHGAVTAHHKWIKDQTQRFLRQTGAVVADLNLDSL